MHASSISRESWLAEIETDSVTIGDMYAGTETTREMDSVVLITRRVSN